MNLKKMAAVWAVVTTAILAWLFPKEIKEKGRVERVDVNDAAKTAAAVALPLVIYEALTRAIGRKLGRQSPLLEALLAAGGCGIITRIFIKPIDHEDEGTLTFISVMAGLASFIVISIYGLVRRTER